MSLSEFYMLMAQAWLEAVKQFTRRAWSACADDGPKWMELATLARQQAARYARMSAKAKSDEGAA
jgi:hypothetical protein